MPEEVEHPAKATDFSVVLRSGFPSAEAAFLTLWAREITDPKSREHLLILDCEKIDLSDPHYAQVWVPYPHEDVVMHLWLPQPFILMIIDSSKDRRPIGFAAHE